MLNIDELIFDFQRATLSEQLATAPPSISGADTATPAPFAAFGASQHYCLVVVATYNEASNIERLIAAILSQGGHYDVLVVDDNSPDGTAELVGAIAAQTSRVQLLRRIGKFGLGTAYMAGFAQALRQAYSYVCQMDADFTHQPHYLPQLLAAAEHGADVALGSRNIAGGGVENRSWLRRLISKGGSRYARVVLGLPIHDCSCAFKCFRASALLGLGLERVASNGYAFGLEINQRCYRAGYTMREVPIVLHDHAAGRSKISRKIVWEAALMVWQLRFGTIAPAPKRRGLVPAPQK